MAAADTHRGKRFFVATSVVEDLVGAIRSEGYTVIGPQVMDKAIVYERLEEGDALPVGWNDEQDNGRYRLHETGSGRLFDYVLGPSSPKTFLYPAQQKLWAAEKQGAGFKLVKDAPQEPPRYAFIGLRPCELAAIGIQDKVFNNPDYADPGYNLRREGAFIVAVNCAMPSGTCFCASMGSGPKATDGFDLALTELPGQPPPGFVVDIGSERGFALLDRVETRTASSQECAAADGVSQAAANGMERRMTDGVEALLKRNQEHPQWEKVAERCLNCANCTLVCPTCFCTTVEDSTDLTGDHAERWRRWDSCFSVDFSYISGGAIRKEGGSRYRQWMTHKLANWHDQFETSGCVGCGRCITWCPVGIDITEEVRIIEQSERRE